MTQYQDDINNMQAASTRAKVQGTSICFGSDSPVRMPQRQRVAQPEAVRTAGQPSLTAVWGVSCDSLSILLGVWCRGDLLQAWSDLYFGRAGREDCERRRDQKQELEFAHLPRNRQPVPAKAHV